MATSIRTTRSRTPASPRTSPAGEAPCRSAWTGSADTSSCSRPIPPPSASRRHWCASTSEKRSSEQGLYFLLELGLFAVVVALVHVADDALLVDDVRRRHVLGLPL